MDKIFDALNKIYSANGFVFTKELSMPLVGKFSVDVHVKATTAKWTLAYANGKGLLTFEPGVSLKIPRFGVTSTLKTIEFDKDKIVIGLSGFPYITYSLKDL